MCPSKIGREKNAGGHACTLKILLQVLATSPNCTHICGALERQTEIMPPEINKVEEEELYDAFGSPMVTYSALYPDCTVLDGVLSEHVFCLVE